jgi:CRP/FNR family transcriptional regulator
MECPYMPIRKTPMVEIIIVAQTCLQESSNRGVIMQTQANIHSIVQQCNICESRGGCLGLQLLDSEEVQHQLSQSKRINRKGEHLFRAGEESDAFFVVRSGSIKSYLVTEDGEEQVLGFYLPGDVFGLDTTESQQRMSSAIILETTSLCRFPHAYLADKAQGANLLKITAEQMQRDHNLVLMLARKDADGRIASFLDDLACRYRSRGYSASEFLLSMSRQDIGCYLGLAVETVSRTLTRFQECGVLQVNRREVEILDHDTLRRIAGTRVNSVMDCSETVELKSV